MKVKFILTILKIGAAILFYFLLVITVVVAGRYAISLFDSKPDNYITMHDDNLQSMFVDPAKKETAPFTYSADRDARYMQAKTLYSIDIRPNSATGYYYMVSTLVFLSLGVLILWTFRKIFKEIKLDAPFKYSVVRHLQVLALLFILSEVLGFIHYFILGKLIKHSFQNPYLHQVSEKGDSLLIGLIILIIAVVYKRGLEIYEENSLTV
jgi:hypothetical protein